MSIPGARNFWEMPGPIQYLILVFPHSSSLFTASLKGLKENPCNQGCLHIFSSPVRKGQERERYCDLLLSQEARDLGREYLRKGRRKDRKN